ncbi:MAG: DUF1343 domain-containing protein [Acidobacteriota bacterium]|nr:MAG: DUF1343 domain-containing protein [Acidobacteriota bacterium]
MGRTGLICNQASVDQGFRHIADLMYHSKYFELTTLFGPQHGIRGDVQDNMVETGHAEDTVTGLPVYSLYSETREPTEKMLSDVDSLVFDLQDVGCRVYTFIYTMANAMRSCAANGKRFVVCDRPNPIGGTAVEGNVLEKGHESFVGQFPIPMRHGMTVGELARLFNEEFGIGCDLEVVEIEGWERPNEYETTGCSWVMPSPNMPTVDTAFVFPGTVVFEGTAVSEGRGTTRPFEQIGAPYIDSEKLAKRMNASDLPGVYFRPVVFLPTFQKHAGIPCGGVFLHVTDRAVFRPVVTGIALLASIMEMYPKEFAWKEPPYEYVFDRNPFDVIEGSSRVRKMLEEGKSHGEIEESWRTHLDSFNKIRERFLLY